MHGGKNTQANGGNQYARKHGIYSTVLSDEEKALWDEVELGRVDDELRLCKLRLMRAIRAENEANGQPELEVITEKPMMVGGVAVTDEEPIKERTLKRRDYAGMIDRLMGRIESLERTRAELMKGAPPDDEPVGKIEIEVVRGKDA